MNTSLPRTVALSTLMMLASQQLPAAEPSFEWVATVGGSGHDKTRCVATDSQGNVFMAGEFTGEAKAGEFTLKSAGQLDFFIVKVSPAGKILWAQRAGGSAIDRGYGVSADKAGNCYVTGHYQSTNCTFGTMAVAPAKDYDVFVAKYGPDGELKWVKTGGGAGYDYGHGIAVGSEGQVYVTGALVGDARFGATGITNEKGSHLFCAQFSPDGDLVWLKTTTGKASNSGHGVAVDGTGNCYAAGFTGGTGRVRDVALTNASGRDVFVAQFRPDGGLGWVFQGAGSTNAMAHEVASDASGNVWISGMFKGDMRLPDGTVARSMGENDMQLTCLNAKGQWLWTQTAGGPKTDYGLGVVSDGRGSVLLTGEFSETATIGGKSLTTRGATDIFVASWNSKGELQRLVQAGGDKGDNAYTIAADSKGDSFISGSFGGTAKFGVQTATSVGGNDAYVAKLRLR